MLIGAVVEVFEHDRIDGSRHLYGDVWGTLHEDFQSIGSAAEDFDFDRIDRTVVRQGGHYADVRGKLHGDFQSIGAAEDFDFD